MTYLEILKFFYLNCIQIWVRMHRATLWMIAHSIMLVLAVLGYAQEPDWPIVIKAVLEYSFRNFLIGDFFLIA